MVLRIFFTVDNFRKHDSGLFKELEKHEQTWYRKQGHVIKRT